MLATVLVPLVVAVVGVLVYALTANPNLKEIGRALMWVGFFWCVAVVARVDLRL